MTGYIQDAHNLSDASRVRFRDCNLGYLDHGRNKPTGSFYWYDMLIWESQSRIIQLVDAEDVDHKER
jgi:hypothetical protein